MPIRKLIMVHVCNGRNVCILMNVASVCLPNKVRRQLNLSTSFKVMFSADDVVPPQAPKSQNASQIRAHTYESSWTLGLVLYLIWVRSYSLTIYNKTNVVGFRLSQMAFRWLQLEIVFSKFTKNKL